MGSMRHCPQRIRGALARLVDALVATFEQTCRERDAAIHREALKLRARLDLAQRHLEALRHRAAAAQRPARRYGVPMMGIRLKVPEVPAYLVGRLSGRVFIPRHWVCRCPYCGQRHRHSVSRDTHPTTLWVPPCHSSVSEGVYRPRILDRALEGANRVIPLAHEG
ncbi:MAG: hypothetical protein M3Z21_14600, partial [Pseudomonadota bacterium]|nr:hypothetical protein [Pseudomonadota bacterium]